MNEPSDLVAESISRGVYRHSLLVRVTHWINAVCIVALLVSGGEILLHHPELYWGETGFFGDPAFLSFGSEEGEVIGMGLARSIHFLGAWILVFNAATYFSIGLIGRHFRTRLFPSRTQLTRANVVQTIRNHVAFRHDHGATDYNLLQKLAYLIVLLLFGPLMVATGLAMSPAVTAAYPWLIEIFGGRQTARTVHFLVAGGLLAFILIHVWQVWLVGWRRGIRGMTTGWLPSHAERTQ